MNSKERKGLENFVKEYDNFKTMKLILNLSLINTKPIKAHIKLIIFSLVYLSILNEWFKDFSFNNEKTMAILDTRLSLIESFIIKAN